MVKQAMMDDLQISVRLEDEPDIVYPSGDTDVPEIDGLKMEPVYSEVQQALIAHFADRDDVLVAGNSFVYFKVEGHPQRTWLDYFVALGVDRDAIRTPCSIGLRSRASICRNIASRTEPSLAAVHVSGSGLGTRSRVNRIRWRPSTRLASPAGCGRRAPGRRP